MVITIPPDLEADLKGRAASEGLTVDAYVTRLLQVRDWHEMSGQTVPRSGDAEFEDIKAAVTDGLYQAARGAGLAAEEAFANLPAKYGIPR